MNIRQLKKIQGKKLIGRLDHVKLVAIVEDALVDVFVDIANDMSEGDRRFVRGWVVENMPGIAPYLSKDKR